MDQTFLLIFFGCVGFISGYGARSAVSQRRRREERKIREAAERLFEVRVNQTRRSRKTQLTNKEKRAKVEAELSLDPARTDSAVATMVGVANDFVGRVRKRMTNTGALLNETPTDDRKSASGKVGEDEKLSKAQPIRLVQ